MSVLRLNRRVVRILRLAGDRGETFGEPEFGANFLVNRVATAGKPVEQRAARASEYLVSVLKCV